MKKILVVHPGTGSSSERVRFLEREVEILRQGCGGDITRAEEILRAHDGRVDAIGLEGMPRRLRLASAARTRPVRLAGRRGMGPGFLLTGRVSVCVGRQDEEAAMWKTGVG